MSTQKNTVRMEAVRFFAQNPEASIKTAMQKFSISQSTAYRCKNDAVDLSNEEDFSLHHDIQIPEKIQDTVSKVEYYHWLLEDEQEGWTFWANQGDVLYNTRGAGWIAIFYPESDEDMKMIDSLASHGVQFAWSLHDMDFWDHDSPVEFNRETGEIIFSEGERYRKNDPKKKHVHLLLKFDSVVTDKYVKRLLHSAFGVQVTLPEVCHNIRGYFNYLIHDTASARKKGKYQYPESRRVCENGFAVGFDDDEKAKILSSIDHYINFDMYKEQHGYEYWMLIQKFDGQWDILKLIRGATNHYQHLLDSKRNHLKEQQEKNRHKGAH